MLGSGTKITLQFDHQPLNYMHKSLCMKIKVYFVLCSIPNVNDVYAYIKEHFQTKINIIMTLRVGEKGLGPWHYF